MRKSVKGFSVFLTVMLLVSLAATGLAAPQRTTLRVAWWGNPTRDERTIEVIEMYQKANPHITIEYETTGWAGYWDKLAAQAAANNLPDVIQHDYAYITQYASQNLLLDLTPYVQANQLDLTGVADTFISGGRLEEKLYGISLGTNAFALVYEPGVLEEAGLPMPAPDWTWADFERMTAKIYNETGILSPVFCTTDPKFVVENMYRQTGQSFFDQSGTMLGFTDPVLLIEFFNIQLRLLKAGMMTRVENAFIDKTPEESDFALGKEWNGFFWSNQFVMMQNAVGRPLDLAFSPQISGSKQPGTYLKPSMFFTVANASRNKDEAVDFVNYFINDLEANKVLLAERGIPIVPKVRDTLKGMVTPAERKVFDFIDLAGEYSSPIDPPEPAGSIEVTNLLRQIDQEVLYGMISPEEAADKFMQQANEILVRNK